MSKEKDRISDDLVENVNGMIESGLDLNSVFQSVVSRQVKTGLLINDMEIRGEDAEHLYNVSEQNGSIINIIGGLLRGRKQN